MQFAQLIRPLVLSLAVLLCACSDKHTSHDGHVHGPQSSSSHGKAGAVPGSYDDWCGEHAVPESKCSRCDSSLVAAFKAANDWCSEHALPESQCLKCNPDIKIVRPPQPTEGAR